MSLQGSIQEMGLGAVIQTLSLNRYRGTLRIETEDAGSQFFFISEGEIILVRQVKKDPVRLGDILIRSGKINDEQLNTALEEQKKERGTRRLGKTLVDLEIIEQDEIEQAVREKFEEDFLDLFLLDQGHFEFIFGLTPESLFGPEEKLERVTLSSSGLMFEAMKRLDEWQDIVKQLGSMDTIYRNRTASLGPKIEDYDFEGVNLPAASRAQLYDLLDGTRSLRDVIATALREGIATRLETFLFLHNLNKSDLVKPLDFSTLMGEAKTALSSGDVPGTAKYIRAILGRKEKLDLALVKRYVEFLTKYKRPRLAFDEARRFAGEALADDDTEQAIALYEMAIGLARNAEVLDRLFYALLRANKRARAVEVGVMFRDFLGSDADLSVATRVCKNLKELDDRNAEVLELSGLILKRQERNEEAVAELDQALGLAHSEHPRRRAIIGAILELQPDRNELRDEQASIELQAAQLQLLRERRRRWVFVIASVAAMLLLWRSYSEYRARVVLRNVEEMAAKDPESLTAIRRLGDKIKEVLGYGFTLVRGRAQELQEENEERWARVLKEQSAASDAKLQAQAEEEARKKAEAERERRLKLVEGELKAYRELVNRGAFQEASGAAVALQMAFADLPDALRGVEVFVMVSSQPQGSLVSADGAALGQTPLAVPVPVGSKRTVQVTRPGYSPQEVELSGAGYAEAKTTLVPGPSWKLTLEEAPLLPVVSDTSVVLARTGGKVSAHSLRDGSQRWELSLGRGVSGAAADEEGELVVVTSGGTVTAIDPESGSVLWKRDIPGGPFRRPVIAQSGGRELVILAGVASVTFLDSKGADARSAPLVFDKPLAGELVAGQNPREPKVFVPLENRLLALDLSEANGEVSGAELWSKASVATGPLLVSRSAEAVVVPTQERLLSLAETSGETLGVLTPGFSPLVGASINAERVTVLGANGFIKTLSAYNGEVLWPGRKVSKLASAGPVAVDRDVALAGEEGRLMRLSSSGMEREAAPITFGQPVDRLVPAGEQVLVVVGTSVYLADLRVE